ncbi:hypothetical protein Tco_1357961 [Tanacetum coccineum]
MNLNLTTIVSVLVLWIDQCVLQLSPPGISWSQDDHRRESMKAEVKCSSWSSWLIRARNTTGRTGRLLVGGGFVFSMMKNGIVNGNYEQSHEEKTDYKKANAREFKFLLERIQASRTKLNYDQNLTIPQAAMPKT